MTGIGFLMPEVVLYNVLTTIVKVLRKDIEDHPSEETEKDSLLYRLMGVDEEGAPLRLNSFNYFKQARKIISKKDNLQVYFGYNLKALQTLSLCILLPGEEGRYTIGADEGYLTDNDGREYLTQTYESNYQVMLTSENSQEVITMYNIIKSMLLMLVPQMGVMGIMNPRFGGQDIVMQDDLSSVPLFHKAINISFQYEHNVPSLVEKELAKSFAFNAKMVLEENPLLDKTEEPGAYAYVQGQEKNFLGDVWVPAYTTSYSIAYAREQLAKKY